MRFLKRNIWRIIRYICIGVGIGLAGYFLTGCTDKIADDLGEIAGDVLTDVAITAYNDYAENNDLPTLDYKIPDSPDISSDLDPEFLHTGYQGDAYICINGNLPYFSDDELVSECFEHYSDLDELGRCGVAYACLGRETMPEYGEKRDSIGNVRPSGWHTVKYNDRIDGNYLYNRCHLIGWQLGAENDNSKNLITGTRYLNIQGMLDAENEVAEYLHTYKDNHVLYRVTPYFNDDNLICEGLLIEARSVETDDVCFCIYCYNVQPGVLIDYKTGESKEDPEWLN